MMGTVELHDVDILSDDDCWSLFAQHAFENRSIDANPNLVLVGKKIVEKCKGLPLAARTLGGLLRCKERDEEWVNVLHSKIWDLPREETDILPALRLSYHHLPTHLKQCFAYCSIIPNDYEFEEEELVLLWMAEGFIQQQREKQMENVGGEYFRELLSRSFFQPSSTGKGSKFVMHDLINDLAHVVARDTCFRLDDKMKDQEQYKNLKKARHSSYMQEHYEGMKKIEIFDKAMHLRTFLPFGSKYREHCYLASNVPLNLFPKLRRLRVLNMSGYFIIELPNSVGDLKHLRYLNLSYSCIKELPDSLGSLYNLQTMMLRGCRELKKLPTDLGYLIDLRHLDTTNAHSLEEMPLGIGKMVSLQTLSNFIVTKNSGHRLRELGNLIYLRGKLCLSGLQNVVVPLDAREANLNDKKGLDVLSMEWSVDSDDSRDGRVKAELHVIDCENLEYIPEGWFHSATNLTSLKIRGCKKLKALPHGLQSINYLTSLWMDISQWNNNFKKIGLHNLSSLKELTLIEGKEEEHPVGSSFPIDGKLLPTSLTKLWIWDFRNLEKLSSKLFQNLASLEELWITDCPRLKSLPVQRLPPSLKELLIRGGCPRLTGKCEKGKGKYWPHLAHIPEVDVADYKPRC